MYNTRNSRRRDFGQKKNVRNFFIQLIQPKIETRRAQLDRWGVYFRERNSQISLIQSQWNTMEGEMRAPGPGVVRTPSLWSFTQSEFVWREANSTELFKFHCSVVWCTFRASTETKEWIINLMPTNYLYSPPLPARHNKAQLHWQAAELFQWSLIIVARVASSSPLMLCLLGHGDGGAIYGRNRRRKWVQQMLHWIIDKLFLVFFLLKGEKYFEFIGTDIWWRI